MAFTRGNLFFRQFTALCWKSWIVLSKHSLVSSKALRNVLAGGSIDNVIAKYPTLLPLTSWIWKYVHPLSNPKVLASSLNCQVFLAVAQTFLLKPNNVRDHLELSNYNA